MDALQYARFVQFPGILAAVHLPMLSIQRNNETYGYAKISFPTQVLFLINKRE